MVTKLHGLSLVGMGLVVYLIASSATAAIVTSSAGTVFKDDFENGDVIGDNLHPEVGTWPLADELGAEVVTNAASPGAFQGQNYLSVGPRGDAISGQFSSAVSSGTLSVTFALLIPAGAEDNVFQFSLSPSISSAGLISIHTAPVWLTNEGGDITTFVGGVDTDTGLAFTEGIWQTYQINYSFVPGPNNDTFTFSLDGNTVGPFNAGGLDNVADPSSLDALGFRNGQADSGGTVFVDATPEPASLGILAIGGVMLLRRRRA